MFAPPLDDPSVHSAAVRVSVLVAIANAFDPDPLTFTAAETMIECTHPLVPRTTFDDTIKELITYAADLRETKQPTESAINGAKAATKTTLLRRSLLRQKLRLLLVRQIWWGDA